jgi:hypothetical protein
MMKAIARLTRGAYLKAIWALFNRSGLAEAWQDGRRAGVEAATADLAAAFALGSQQALRHQVFRHPTGHELN